MLAVQTAEDAEDGRENGEELEKAVSWTAFKNFSQKLNMYGGA